MLTYLSEEEYQSCLHNASGKEKADAFMRKLYNHLESVKAQVGTASTTVEQSRSLLKQKSVSPCDVLAQVRADEHQILPKCVIIFLVLFVLSFSFVRVLFGSLLYDVFILTKFDIFVGVLIEISTPCSSIFID